jgi:hypothetical protein
LEGKIRNTIAHLALFLGIFLISIFIYGCANQQPPGGGLEDKIPPKVKIIAPQPNTLNFKGNSISYEFDEYVDRRSFQDAFRISPQIKGDVEYDWSGKSVDVRFEKPFYKIDANKTFVVTVNTALKDIHGNPITTPAAFAFSTGDKIDKCSISGKVYNGNSKNISIFAYKLGETDYDPAKNFGDYQTETSPDGVYTLTNMAPATYRVIAIDDDDKNYLYTSERESYGVLPEDITLKEDGALRRVNFLMKQINAIDSSSELNTDKYFKDTLSIVSSSIKYDSRNILPEQSIFIFFNKFKPSREALSNSLQVKDENNVPEKFVLNWRNDSLVEVFAANKFSFAKAYNLSLSLNTDKDTLYNFNLKFRVVSNNSFGEMKGSVQVLSFDSTGETITEVPVIKIFLESKDITPVIKYAFESADSVFSFKKIVEADYTLFSFIDSKNTGTYFYGNPFPFEYSEPFTFYPQTLAIKGGWTVENVIVTFVK